MIDLSIIIVNYNVRHFLEQALISVRKAVQNLQVEIFVVDNHSVDGSVQMLREKFPEVRVIVNEKNHGFSKANNQAIHLSNGKYLLFLNPDTIVEEDTFTKSIQFMNAHPTAGGLGVMMIDGKGNYLPESKRGLPSPWVAFYKIFGLCALFPRTKKFGKYYMGHLDKNKTHEIEVLAGAFMLLRKETLVKTGFLDENFFMYGEDIDISYRITQAGFKLYYFPETRIIHYKGESTKKTSMNYVKVFYNAMFIFARKHFSGNQQRIFSVLINTAIFFRAGIAMFNRLFQKIYLPLTDALVISGGMYWLKHYWEKNHKYIEGGHYPPEFMWVAVPLYILFWLGSVYFFNGYDKPIKASNIFKGIITGTVLVSAFTNFIDPIRFSKALIILGAAWSIFSMIIIRLLFHFMRYKNFAMGDTINKKTLIAGKQNEATRVLSILRKYNSSADCSGFLSPENGIVNDKNYLGNLKNLPEVVQVFGINEVIFCNKDIPSNEIINWMMRLDHLRVEYKIVPDESNFIIGSQSTDSIEDLISIDFTLAISKKENIRNKRIFDMLSSFFFLVSAPLSMWFTTNPTGFIKNSFRVFTGKLSWVGFSKDETLGLPDIKTGILSPWDKMINKKISPETTKQLNYHYAKDFSFNKDISLTLRCFKSLGRKVE